MSVKWVLRNKTLWRIIRSLMRWALSRSARKILLSRGLGLSDGTPRRWFQKDVNGFLNTLDNEVQFQRSIADLETLPNIWNRIMVEFAIYTAASYRVMIKLGLSKVLARQTISDIGWDVYASLMRLSSLPFRLATRDPAKRLRWTIQALLRFPFTAPGAPGYAVKHWSDDQNIYTHFTHCPPQSFVRKLVQETGDQGDMDAFYDSWCLYDTPGSDVIANDGQRGHYRRKQTLSRGDPVCDMCWAAQIDPPDRRVANG